MSSFHLSLSSITTPKNCVDFTHCMDVFCIIASVQRVKFLRCEIPCNAFLLNSLTLIINLIALSQISILFNASFSISTNYVYSLPYRKTLVASAKRMVKFNLDALEKSSLKRINRSGHKIDPCGSLYSMDCVLELYLL